MNPDKPVHAHNVPTKSVTNFSRGQVPQEKIAERAKKLWLERGSPTGQDEAIWFEAEARLKAEAESKPVSGTASRPYVDEPGKPLATRTKSRDPADAAAQPRSATEGKSKQTAGKLRSQ